MFKRWVSRASWGTTIDLPFGLGFFVIVRKPEDERMCYLSHDATPQEAYFRFW